MLSPQSLDIKADINDLSDCLRIASVSSSKEHVKDVQECAQFLCDTMAKIGLENIQIFQTDGHPIVYGDYLHATDAPTLLIYGHYDVQPEDPVNLWESPPFEPSIRDGFIYARGASDNKGQFYCHLKSIQHLLAQTNTLPVNIKFIIEGEEEIGSPNLRPFLDTHKETLKADIALISDTPMLNKETPSICTSLRGLVYFKLHLKTAETDCHSGQHGGCAPNAITELCTLISKLKLPDGRIAIPGIYDDVAPIPDTIRHNLDKLPFNESQYNDSLGLKACISEPDTQALERLWYRPSLDCHGIMGGFTEDGAKTVIPKEASASFSLRLVANQSPSKVETLVKDYLHDITPSYGTLTITQHHSAEPVSVANDIPAINAALTALERAFSKTPVLQGEGGSIPVVADLKSVLGLDTVLMGLNFPDDNIHAPNERFSLDNYQKGILASAYFFEEMAKLGKNGL